VRHKRTTKKFVLTITTAADIADTYPNFKFNWDTPDQFIRQLCKHIESLSKDSAGKNSFGHSITVGQR